MPITVNILENKVFARAYERGYCEGLRRILRPQITQRFGPIPPWVEERLTTYSSATLEELGVRLLDAANLEDLLTISFSESP